MKLLILLLLISATVNTETSVNEGISTVTEVTEVTEVTQESTDDNASLEPGILYRSEIIPADIIMQMYLDTNTNEANKRT